MRFIKEKLVKSPLNYVGGKFKLLPQILPLLPDDINIFYDLFCGGCNVGINVKANKIICNDIQTQLIELLSYFSTTNDNVITRIESIIKDYGFSDTFNFGYSFYNTSASAGVAKFNKDKFFKLRHDYNLTPEPILFFAVIIFAFSNQIRFNSIGQFNNPVNKRDFNKSVRTNTTAFINRLKNINIDFLNKDFSCFDLDIFNQDDFVFCDPPYLISDASYNKSWNEVKEKQLLCFLDSLNDRNIRFALSNVLEHKGNENTLLKDWSSKYNIHFINSTYRNCNYNKKDKSLFNTVEVLITNF